MSLYDSLLEKMEGRPYSNYFSTFCPFDPHAKPALLVYDDGYFVCLSCGKKGTLAYLAKQVGSHYRPERLTQSQYQVLPRWRKWEQKWGDVEGIARNAHKSLKAFPQFQSYFKKRKIYEYVEQGYFGYIDGWICFPVRNWSGQIIDMVVRSVSRKGDTRYVVYPDDSDSNTRPLYSPSWERVKKAETVYVVYGLIDSWAMESIGLACVTGITGKSLPADLLKPMNKKFVIIPDLGEEREAYLLDNKLWNCTVKILRYPDDTKDPDGVRIKFGNDYLKNLMGE